MRIKPHIAVFWVIIFAGGVLIGHYLPIMDTLLPKAEGKVPSISDAIQELLGSNFFASNPDDVENSMTANVDSDKTGESGNKNGKTIVRPKATETKGETRIDGFLKTPVRVIEVDTDVQLKVQNARKEDILIFLHGFNLRQQKSTLRDRLSKLLVGQELWLIPAMVHDAKSPSILVYAYVIPKNWKPELGSPTDNRYLLNNLVSQAHKNESAQ